MWSYKKPKTPGLYYVNRGDVVTKESLEVIKVDRHKKSDDYLSDAIGVPLSEYNDCYKFMMIDYEKLNAIGNALELEIGE